MKKLFVLLVFVAVCSLASGQTESASFKKKQLANKQLASVELKNQVTTTDFSKLWTHTENSLVYGFIGDNYQRIRIKLISVTKDTSSSDTYLVYGKSMVKNNIDEFHGTIKISNIRKFKKTSLGVDDELKGKGIKGQYIIVGNYSFSENKKQNHSGVFKGIFKTDFYLDKNNNVHYDNIDLNADGYINNQFIGQWIEYKTNLAKRCNWGDYRIPNSGSFDIGAGDFSPNDQYLKYGWQSIRDLMTSNNKNIKAKAVEEAKWWK